MKKKKPAGKIAKVMKEYSAGKLRSGKKGPGQGPKVKKKSQALAIGYSEAKKSKKR